MKIPIAISDEQRLTSAKNRHHSSSKHCFKAEERRQINKEERNKRIGLSEEKIKELDGSGKAFFQMMLRANGELFWFRWQKGNKEPPKGFRFKPYNLNKSMWFLFTNQLEESLQNMTDEDRQERAMRGFLCCRWAVGNNIVRPCYDHLPLHWETSQARTCPDDVIALGTLGSVYQ